MVVKEFRLLFSSRWVNVILVLLLLLSMVFSVKRVWDERQLYHGPLKQLIEASDEKLAGPYDLDLLKKMKDENLWKKSTYFIPKTDEGYVAWRESASYQSSYHVYKQRHDYVKGLEKELLLAEDTKDSRRKTLLQRKLNAMESVPDIGYQNSYAWVFLLNETNGFGITAFTPSLFIIFLIARSYSLEYRAGMMELIDGTKRVDQFHQMKMLVSAMLAAGVVVVFFVMRILSFGLGLGLRKDLFLSAVAVYQKLNIPMNMLAILGFSLGVHLVAAIALAWMVQWVSLVSKHGAVSFVISLLFGFILPIYMQVLLPMNTPVHQLLSLFFPVIAMHLEFTSAFVDVGSYPIPLPYFHLLIPLLVMGIFYVLMKKTYGHQKRSV